ncbi:hypothetical protein JXB31_04800 [Candidatus Woesearchaeota archaeon]|nr:hypothetical protein [Candidatus Woesearchaeota archaeon]
MLVDKKRGQVTIFIIVGLIFLFSVALVMYLNSYKRSFVSLADHSETKAVQMYFENALQVVTDECLYDIGLHGGYINPDDAAFYGDDYSNSASYTEYFGEKVPIYITDVDEYKFPGITEIEERLEKYILVRLQETINLDSFRRQGINIIGPSVDFSMGYVETDNVSINVRIKDNTVSVSLEYPLTIDKNSSRSIIKDFSYNAPFRLKQVHDAIVDRDIGILDGISDRWREIDKMDNKFYLEDFDCDPLDNEHFITIYSLNNGASDERIIRVIDYKNFFKTMHGKGYVYQFAVKKDPIWFSGNVCKGTIIY